jgi:hypothetical protein
MLTRYAVEEALGAYRPDPGLDAFPRLICRKAEQKRRRRAFAWRNLWTVVGEFACVALIVALAFALIAWAP